MRRTFKYRIYPTVDQEEELKQWLDTCRWLYNQSLNDRKVAYDYAKAQLNYYDQANALKVMKKDSMGLQKVHSQVLQDVLKRLDKAFLNFFRRVKSGEKPGYPRFKSRDRYDSFTFPQSGYKIEGSKLILSKIGAINLKQHREIPEDATIKTCAIKRDVNQWYVSFVVEFTDAKSEKKEIVSVVGVDVGLKEIATLSTGEKIPNPRWLRTSEQKLAKEQRRLSRKKKGSKNRRKQKTQVAKVHRTIRNQRKDFHHKLSRELANRYDLIVFEDLKIKNMLKNHYLAKSISDAGWNELVNFTSYKAEWAGGFVEQVYPNGTSIECYMCGEEVPKSLSVRVHRCPKCGDVRDRDWNAALNIRRRGLEKIGQELSKSITPVEMFAGMSPKQEATQLVGW